MPGIDRGRSCVLPTDQAPTEDHKDLPQAHTLPTRYPPNREADEPVPKRCGKANASEGDVANESAGDAGGSLPPTRVVVRYSRQGGGFEPQAVPAFAIEAGFEPATV